MRLVYFGTGPFAVPALRALGPERVILAVAQPARPTGRGLKLVASPVEVAAREMGIEVATPEKARDAQFVERIESLTPDALVVASYGQILPLRLLNAARRGGINLHGSILPAWRGAAPIQRAIEAGDSETGVTLMQMDKGMDTGDMIALARTPIHPEENYGSLQERLAILAADLLTEWIDRIVAGDYPRIPQPTEGVSLAAKVTKDDARLDLSRPAAELARRVRAFTPAPGAWLESESGRIGIREARTRPEMETVAISGTILPGKELIVATGAGALELVTLQPPGKSPMSGAAYRNGRRLTAGDRV